MRNVITYQIYFNSSQITRFNKKYHQKGAVKNQEAN